MKNAMLRSLSLVALSLSLTLSAAAQDAKVKINDKEDKYKSEDLKVKDKKGEAKIKGDDLKIKDEQAERKIKAKVVPMHRTMTERDELKTGQTHVRTKERTEQVSRLNEEETTQEPVTAEPVAVPPMPAPTPSPRGYASHKKVYHRPVAARRPRTANRTVVRTKVVRDTVFMPGEPIVTKEYVHDTVNQYDTVTVTRVDTMIKVQKENTYTGYRVPRGDFKKVKLRKGKDDEVWMKRKEDGKTKKEKLKEE